MSIFESAFGGIKVSYLDESSIYENIRATVTEAQKKVFTTVNFVMVETYWNI